MVEIARATATGLADVEANAALFGSDYNLGYLELVYTLALR